MRLVRVVLEATAQVLAEVGLETTSTNKVARRAGVSVGSIYQYFSNKEELFDALADDRVHQLEGLVAERMSRLHDTSFPAAAEVILRAAVDFFASEAALAPMLVARITAPFVEHGRAARLNEVARAYLQHYADDLLVTDLDMAAALCVHVVGQFAPLIALSIHEPGRRERLIAEVVAMLSRYVGADATSDDQTP